MPDAKNVLEMIVLEFPQHKQEITQLFCESSNFIETCEDYTLCLWAIRNLESNGNEINRKEINDLSIVLNDLEIELMSSLK